MHWVKYGRFAIVRYGSLENPLMARKKPETFTLLESGCLLIILVAVCTISLSTVVCIAAVIYEGLIQ